MGAFKKHGRNQAHDGAHDAANADGNGIGDELRAVCRFHERKREALCKLADDEKFQNKRDRRHNGQFMQGKQKGFACDTAGVQRDIVDNHAVDHDNSHDSGENGVLYFVFVLKLDMNFDYLFRSSYMPV